MTHTEHEDDPWTASLRDHPARTDSVPFQHAKALAHKIMALLLIPFYGKGPWQMHHGGSIWLFDNGGWFLVLNLAGIEWSMQFIADPPRVDALRQNALRITNAFPDTLSAMRRFNYPDTDILTTPITDEVGVGRYVDSIWNSCVPLAAPVHTGIITPAHPVAGVHHYPTPVQAAEYFKAPDYNLWVTDPATGTQVAVVPAVPRSQQAKNRTVELVWAPPGHPLATAHAAAHAAGRRLLLEPEHELARQVYAPAN